MKKVLLILAAALLAAPTMNAQDDAGVRFGIKLAPNMSWFRSDTKGIEGNGSKLGYTFGLSTEFPIGEKGNYRFATGLFLNVVGGKYNQAHFYRDSAAGPQLEKKLENSINLQYIQIPLTMKLMTNEIGYMRYYGQVGFDAGFNVKAKADYDEVVTDPNTQAVSFRKMDKEDIKNSIQPIRVGLVVGAGMEYNFSGSTTVQAGLTYNNGLTNLLKKTEIADAAGAKRRAKLLQNYLELNLALFF